jgi:hypothetical protein
LMVTIINPLYIILLEISKKPYNVICACSKLVLKKRCGLFYPSSICSS